MTFSTTTRTRTLRVLYTLDLDHIFSNTTTTINNNNNNNNTNNDNNNNIKSTFQSSWSHSHPLPRQRWPSQQTRLSRLRKMFSFQTEWFWSYDRQWLSFSMNYEFSECLCYWLTFLKCCLHRIFCLHIQDLILRKGLYYFQFNVEIDMTWYQYLNVLSLDSTRPKRDHSHPPEKKI